MIPPNLKLSPQQQRVFDVLQDWASAEQIQKAMRGKTPAKVIISQLRFRLARYGLTIECSAFYKRGPDRRWRVAPKAHGRSGPVRNRPVSQGRGAP